MNWLCTGLGFWLSITEWDSYRKESTQKFHRYWRAWAGSRHHTCFMLPMGLCAPWLRTTVPRSGPTTGALGHFFITSCFLTDLSPIYSSSNLFFFPTCYQRYNTFQIYSLLSSESKLWVMAPSHPQNCKTLHALVPTIPSLSLIPHHALRIHHTEFLNNLLTCNEYSYFLHGGKSFLTPDFGKSHNAFKI